MTKKNGNKPKMYYGKSIKFYKELMELKIGKTLKADKDSRITPRRTSIYQFVKRHYPHWHITTHEGKKTISITRLEDRT